MQNHVRDLLFWKQLVAQELAVRGLCYNDSYRYRQRLLVQGDFQEVSFAGQNVGFEAEFIETDGINNNSLREQSDEGVQLTFLLSFEARCFACCCFAETLVLIGEA